MSPDPESPGPPGGGESAEEAEEIMPDERSVWRRRDFNETDFLVSWWGGEQDIL